MTSLYNACKAAILHGNCLTDIRRPDLWAQTYSCTTEEVKEAWEAALTELTRNPQNSFEMEGK